MIEYTLDCVILNCYIFIYYTNSILDSQIQLDKEKQSEQTEQEILEEEILEVETDIAEAKEQPDFLKDINITDADSSLGIQLNQMLRKYMQRKRKLEEREKEVSAIMQKFK